MRIGELSARSGVSARSLRYYEEQRLLAPTRTAGGQRVYSPQDLAVVIRIRELFQAGFCSSVIHELLPALSSPTRDDGALGAAFDAAAARLISEKASIEAELSALRDLRSQWGLAPDMHVSVQGAVHDALPTTTTPTPFDHRDRRLR